MRRAFLGLTVLALLLGTARADHQQDNLRPLTSSDLCPPVAYVAVDDEEQQDLAVALDEQLDRYATLYGVPYGDPKTCTVDQIFTLDAFKARDGRMLYALDLSLQTAKPARLTLGTHTFDAKALELWSSSGYGSVAGQDDLADMAVGSVREYYEELALAWKATHKK
ncbi:hypothetical protein [Deinococcus aestuarii]|uniref:hypothetical protein n=1 Tax=Deinococcus aestuarii TaxID=2774531 RepID=UPI001C0DD173|nr:hypothetical protein [Deinococcus aestuarii]